MEDLGIDYTDNIRQDHPQYLNDESGIISDGYADGLLFPTNGEELKGVVEYSRKHNIPITISGGGTGLSGGRVPYGGWIVATDKMTHVRGYTEEWTDPESRITYGLDLHHNPNNIKLRVPIAMTLKSIQNYCKEKSLFYPPDATERTAFIGGNVATNASGARSFKFGATRNWVEKISVVLPDGQEIQLARDEDEDHFLDDRNIHLSTPDLQYDVPRPTYSLPETEKNVAGPVITDRSKPIDLFIGTGGLFGIISEVTIRLIPEPGAQVSMFVFTQTHDQALDLVEFCRQQRDEKNSPIPLSVEYLGPNATAIMKSVDATIPKDTVSVVIIEQDAISEEELYVFLEFWIEILDKLGIEDTSVALDRKEIEHHKFLRHKVPETVNAIVKGYGQSKLGSDCSVPSTHLRELFSLVFQLGDKFSQYQHERGADQDMMSFALWAHAGDAHLHLNLLPHSDEEMNFAKSLFVELMEQVISWKGSIAAEHGLGKKYFVNKPALEFQYGSEGIHQITKMKEVLDPRNLLNPDNLLGIRSR